MVYYHNLFHDVVMKCCMAIVVYIGKSNSVFVSSAILKLSITDISPGAESHEEQDGTNLF